MEEVGGNEESERKGDRESGGVVERKRGQEEREGGKRE